jgi:hypothetical protein
MTRQTLEARLLGRINRKRGDLFLRADFNGIGDYARVGHALRGLVRDGHLLKLGYGVYARARPSLLDGKPTPVKGMRELAAEALDRLGIKTELTDLEKAYNAGRTSQVPTGRVIGVSRPVRRKLVINGIALAFVAPARRTSPHKYL